MNRAPTTLFWFLLTLVVSLGLYHTSYRVEELGQNLRVLNSKIQAEQRSIHILKAEYVFLTNPSRIEEASRKHLALQPTNPGQIARLGKLPSIIPTRVETAGRAIPIASLPSRMAAHKPIPVVEETERLNTHLVIHKTARAAPIIPDHSLAILEEEEGTYNLAVSGNAP